MTVLFCAALFYCSSCKKEEVEYRSVQPQVRSEVENSLKAYVWSDELSPGGIDSLAEENGIYLQVPLSDGTLLQAVPASTVAGAASPSENVYPSYGTFGLLDISAAPEDLPAFLDRFFDSAVKPDAARRTIPFAMLDRRYPFLPLLLREGFASIPAVTNWLYGTVQKTGTGWEVPVRMICSGSYADMTVFVCRNASSYAVEQIYFGETVYE